MTIQRLNSYPGTDATALEIATLASDFRRSAEMLLERTGHRKLPLSVPGRFCAVQSIELFLHAFLLVTGVAPEEIRGLHHDFSRKATLALQKGLVLRAKTVRHLSTMTASREYLVLRYGPEQVACVSEVTRVLATLRELSEKVMPVVRAATSGAT